MPLKGVTLEPGSVTEEEFELSVEPGEGRKKIKVRTNERYIQKKRDFN